METVPPPASHFVNAAHGWLMLGCPAEAARELDQIGADFWNHPEVMDARYSVHSSQNNWEMALMVAREWLHRTPDNVSAWLDHAYSLRRVAGGGIKAAWRALQPALRRFPKEPIVAYNLSCYACQMDQMEDARKLLQSAFRNGDRETLKKMALEDADLRPLWVEIVAL